MTAFNGMMNFPILKMKDSAVDEIINLIEKEKKMDRLHQV